MKFVILGLLAAICALGASASTLEQRPATFDLGMEYDALELSDMETDEFIVVETIAVVSTVFKYVKLALRCVKGFNCVVKWAYGIKDNAQQYNTDIEACGKNVTKQMTRVINANLQLMITANNIINLRTNVCNADESTSPKITPVCAARGLYQTVKLYRQVLHAIRLAKQIPQTGPSSDQCVTDSTNKLIDYYTQFPSDMFTCSKLTGN